VTCLQLPVRKRGDGTRYVAISQEQADALGAFVGCPLVVQHHGVRLRASMRVWGATGVPYVHVFLGVPDGGHSVQVSLSTRSVP
jgi:hypothetical protein